MDPKKKKKNRIDEECPEEISKEERRDLGIFDDDRCVIEDNGVKNNY